MVGDLIYIIYIITNYTPIPERYNKLRHPSDTYRVSVSSSKAKVCHFDRAAIVHEQVAGLEVSM
jgi:hypothetical protein